MNVLVRYIKILLYHTAGVYGVLVYSIFKTKNIKVHIQQLTIILDDYFSISR